MAYGLKACSSHPLSFEIVSKTIFTEGYKIARVALSLRVQAHFYKTVGVCHALYTYVGLL